MPDFHSPSRNELDEAALPSTRHAHDGDIDILDVAARTSSAVPGALD
jgi:hypothetical protein